MAKEITLDDVNKALDRLKDQWIKSHENNKIGLYKLDEEKIHFEADQAFLEFLESIGRPDVADEFDPHRCFWYG